MTKELDTLNVNVPRGHASYFATVNACIKELPLSEQETLNEQWDYLKGLYKIKIIEGNPTHAISEYLLRLPAENKPLGF